MTQLLKSGSKGEPVKALQQKLVGLGFSITADGLFGPGTKSAVEELQALFGYDVDGIVGDGTLKLVDQQLGLTFSVKDPATLKRAVEASPAATQKRLLKRGVEGGDVSLLQRKLGLLGYTVAVDGKYGDATEQAVRAVQQAFGYDVDGDVGDATHKLIDQQAGLGFNVQSAEAIKKAIVAQGNATKLKRTLESGFEGADVRFLQRRLLALGYTVSVDGKFGPATEKAVRALQQAFGYDVDGIVGEATHKLLNQQIGLGWTAGAPTAAKA
jgi:peptidoglycan hydrolase-like protein with peptidoglycan-binding domain